MSDERDPGAAPAKSMTGEPAYGIDRGDRVHEFHGQGVSVTWSRRRCLHVGECVMQLPAVFKPGRRPWVDTEQASPDVIARVVAHCPTGALHCARRDGGVAEIVPSTNSVLVAPHGPVYLRGDIELLDESGVVRLADTRVALCRCGQSECKPLCDGSHSAAGFRDAGAVHDASSVQDSGPLAGTLWVRPQRDGPLGLDGPFILTGADPRTVLSGSSAHLCRCGHSQNKPFCDGSHEQAAFRSG